mmetsp:Transcript_13549/g.17190  ORF Transcript_13549/g.17190 Transcript_13549/m.17190 type:complete len:89 (+) Transcript_13549:352-618(+)
MCCDIHSVQASRFVSGVASIARIQLQRPWKNQHFSAKQQVLVVLHLANRHFNGHGGFTISSTAKNKQHHYPPPPVATPINSIDQHAFQ